MSISDDDIRAAIAETFRVESDEHIQAINRLLLRLEQGGVANLTAVLDEIAREAHTLKGASAILGLSLIEETAHAMEAVFEALRDAEREAPPELFDLLYSALDRLAIGCQRVEDPTGADREILEALQSACHSRSAEIRGRGGSAAPHVPPSREETPPAPAAAPAESREPAPPSAPTRTAKGPALTEPHPPEADATRPSEETIRVPIRKLDSLMAQIGELLIAKIRNEDRLGTLRQLQTELEDTNRDWVKLKDARRVLQQASPQQSRSAGHKYQELLDRVEGHIKTLTHRVAALGQEFARDAMHMAILADNLQEDIKRARMLPVSTILDGYHRLVRDVARREGKQAVLMLQGTDTEVDKRVLELIKDPLMHLLRNAVSHGIESPSDRLRVGKEPTGTITVRTHQSAGNIIIEVEDDGAGIDADLVLDKAVSRGLVDPTAARAMPREQILQLIFQPGLSTRETVTDISGRGIGMDVVRDNVLRVQGEITIETAASSGTRIVISLPLTLSTTKCLVVESGGQTFAVPITAVERILRIEAGDVQEIEGERAILVGGAPVALARLSDILGIGAPVRLDGDVKTPVVVLSASGTRLGLIVDSLVDEQEMVIKPLGKQLGRVRNLTGGTILGNGSVMLVLNPQDLLRSGSDARLENEPDRRGEGERPGARRRIVLAEDSITTRTMERTILESAGYAVVPCGDGLEALRALQAERADALITDVNMPGMDGIELIERVRALDAYADLPILLVTSLGSEEDRRRGMLAGANAYIVKRDFEQGRFLHVLGELI